MSCVEATYPLYSFGNDGYPRMHDPLRGNTSSAVRVLWEKEHGRIPEDHEPDHLCGNKRCVNLEHVQIVSSYFNNARAHRKLSPTQVAEIRDKLGTTTKAAIAREYGVSFMTITRIERGHTYEREV